MKINCQSCEAKYTIADEKVRGKTVKIRCKKCGAAILVKGEDVAPALFEEEEDATRIFTNDNPLGMMSLSPAAPVEWTVTLPDGEQRSASIDELSQLVATGAITGETYAWREGMEDWQPLSQLAELSSILPPPKPVAAPRPAVAAAAPFPAAPIAAETPKAAARVAARRPERAADQDLFGAAHRAGSDEQPVPPPEIVASPGVALPSPKHNFTSERGEASVLFSVEAIRATGKPMPSRAPIARPETVDFGQLASETPSPMGSAGNFDGPSFNASAFGPPMLPSGVEPEPPPPEVVAAVPVQAPAPQKSSKGLVIGLAAAVGLLAAVSLAFGGYVVFGKTTPVETSPKPSAAVTAPTAAPTVTAQPDTPATATATAPTATVTAEAPAETATAATGTVAPAGTVKVGGPLPTPTGGALPADTKKEKEPPPPEPPPPAPATGAEFSKSAAVSALNSAAGAAAACKKADGPTGRGRASVTFAPSGRVTSATVDGAPFAGTSVGGCVAAAFRRASVPPFVGSPVTVHKSFSIQ